MFYLGHVAFRMKGDATGITLAEGTTQIYDNAFYDCQTLASIIIPATVASIGARAFQQCRDLSRVYVLRTTPITTLGSNTFLSCDDLTDIVVPDPAFSDYYCSTEWNNSILTSGYTVTCSSTNITATSYNMTGTSPWSCNVDN